MAGFTTTKTNPKNLIKNLRKNTKALTPQNLDETIDLYRSAWNDDYGQRYPNTPLTQEELLQPKVREWRVGGYKKPPKWNNTALERTKILFTGDTDHWHFQIIQFPSGKKEFSFNVLTGGMFIWHTGQVENFLQGHDEETIREWKRMVMKSFLPSIQFFLNEAQKALPGFKAWSITSSDKSTKLLQQVKDDRLVTLNQGVCFLFL